MALSRYASLLALSVFGATALAQDQIAPEGELLVKTRSNTISPVIRMALGATVQPAIPQLGIVKVKFSKRNNRQAMQMLRQDTGVVYSEPNYRKTYRFDPNDPRLAEQYGIPQIKTNQAWEIFRNPSMITIAVIDSGLRRTHEDITTRVVRTYNTSNDSTDVTDDNGHGTHCMGIAAATTNNGKGVASAAFNARLMAIKMGGTIIDSAKGIVFAADNGAKIISMSYGGPTKTQVEEDAVAYAWSKGVLLFAASGNDDSNQDALIGYPSLFPNVINIGATDKSGGKAIFSNFGPKVQLAAPGDNILSLGIGSDTEYVLNSGTSMACPFAASAAALVWGRNPSLRNSEVRNILYSTAIPVAGGWVTEGLIDVNSAVAKARPLPPITADPIMTKVSTAGGLNQGTQSTGYGTPEDAAGSTKLNDTAYFGIRSRMLNKVGMVAGVETSIQLSQPIASVQTARIELSATAPSPASAMVFAYSNTSGQYQMIGQFANRGMEQSLEFGMNPQTMGQYFNGANEIKLLIRWIAPQRVNQTPFEVRVNRLTITGTYDPDLAP